MVMCQDICVSSLLGEIEPACAALLAPAQLINSLEATVTRYCCRSVMRANEARINDAAPATDQGTTSDTTSDGWLTLRSEEHTSELQSRFDLVCRLLLEK